MNNKANLEIVWKPTCRLVHFVEDAGIETLARYEKKQLFIFFVQCGGSRGGSI